MARPHLATGAPKLERASSGPSQGWPDADSGTAGPGLTDEEIKMLEPKRDLANRNKLKLRQLRADSGQP